METIKKIQGGRPVMRPEMRKSVLLRVRMTEGMIADVELAAEEQGESVSVVVRDAIRHYLNRDWK